MGETKPFVPAVVFHPSEYIAEESRSRGWTLHMLAAMMGGNIALQVVGLQLYAICQPGVLLGDDGAADLGRAFGSSAEIWSRMDALWQQHHERHSPPDDDHAAFFGLNEPADEPSVIAAAPPPETPTPEPR